jgi:hypothetical protein
MTAALGDAPGAEGDPAPDQAAPDEAADIADDHVDPCRDRSQPRPSTATYSSSGHSTVSTSLVAGPSASAIATAWSPSVQTRER